MADRGVLFSGPMVVALLEGRKTQTRRLVMTADEIATGPWTLARFFPDENVWKVGLEKFNSWKPVRIPYRVGDRLWVREAWATLKAVDCVNPAKLWDKSPLIYFADGATANIRGTLLPTWGRLRASMHMPRWASRLTLTVQRVRVQRLQEITNEDAVAEGAEIDRHYRDTTQDQSSPPMVARAHGYGHVTVRGWYHELWDSLNRDRAPWDSNPWVVAYTFSVARKNIDEA